MSSRARWFGLLFISIAVSLIIVDSTIVNVAIPSIVRALVLTLVVVPVAVYLVVPQLFRGYAALQRRRGA